MIHVTLKDGSVKELEAGVSVIDVAKVWVQALQKLPVQEESIIRLLT